MKKKMTSTMRMKKVKMIRSKKKMTSTVKMEKAKKRILLNKVCNLVGLGSVVVCTIDLKSFRKYLFFNLKQKTGFTNNRAVGTRKV